MRPIVQIGYHKTATTWFQKQVYPQAISHRWVPRDIARAALLDPWGLAFDPGEATRRLEGGGDSRPPVLCEENLSGYIHNGGLHGLMAPEAARRIKAALPDAIIVIVVRAQPDVIAASYVQYVRGGGTHGPARYLFAARHIWGAARHAYKVPRFAFEHFEYDRLIAHYDGMFGRENVVVLPYEELRRDPTAFLDRLCEGTGLTLDRPAIRHRAANRSFGAVTVAIGRLLGLFTSRSVQDKSCLISLPGFYEIRRLILALLSRIDPSRGGRSLLGTRILAHAADHYRASNARLAALRDIDLVSFGYPLPQPDMVEAREPVAPPTEVISANAPLAGRWLRRPWAVRAA